jgi:hypothetical protein
MKTRMNQNSIKTFENIERPTKAYIIYAYIKEVNEPISYIKLANDLKMPVPTVVGRLNELMYDYQLIKVGLVRNNINHYVLRQNTDKFNLRDESNTVTRKRVIEIHDVLQKLAETNQLTTESITNTFEENGILTSKF